MSHIEISRSPSKKYDEVILIVPNFAGIPDHFKRHTAFLNNLGFDVAIIDLQYNSFRNLKPVPFSKDLKLGLRHVWADQIEQAFTLFTGPKVLYSFSFPSCSALEAIDRIGGRNISAWICDGGPFLEMQKCYYNLFTHSLGVKNFWLRKAAGFFSSIWLGERNYVSDIHSYLNHLPKGFPILNIRTWQDRLVPATAIEAVFKGHPDLNLEVLSIPNADHLQGLIKEAELYKSRVSQFLTANCTKVKDQSSNIDLV